MCWTGWPNAINIFNATCRCLCAPGPWCATSGPSAHALVQQLMLRERGQTRMTSCNIQNATINVAWMWPNTYNIMQHPKCCTKNLTVFKFDPTSSNMLQHIATYSQQGGPAYATCCAQQCFQMLGWNVASVWPGLKGTFKVGDSNTNLDVSKWSWINRLY